MPKSKKSKSHSKSTTNAKVKAQTYAQAEAKGPRVAEHGIRGKSRHQLNRLAAIRWYVNNIENLAIQRYFGNVEHWPAVQEVLSRTMHALQFHGSLDNGDSEIDCPWIKCQDGSCAPECFF